MVAQVVTLQLPLLSAASADEQELGLRLLATSLRAIASVAAPPEYVPCPSRSEDRRLTERALCLMCVCVRGSEQCVAAASAGVRGSHDIGDASLSAHEWAQRTGL